MLTPLLLMYCLWSPCDLAYINLKRTLGVPSSLRPFFYVKNHYFLVLTTGQITDAKGL